MPDADATQEERQRAKDAIESAVWDETFRVIHAIRVEAVLGGFKPALSIRLDRFSGGPALRIEDDELTGLQIALLQELVAGSPNLQLEMQDGRLELTSPSWPPDRIPF